MFISNRPLSAVLAALAVAAAFVIAGELYPPPSESIADTAEASAVRCCGCAGLRDRAIAKQLDRTCRSAVCRYTGASSLGTKRSDAPT